MEKLKERPSTTGGILLLIGPVITSLFFLDFEELWIFCLNPFFTLKDAFLSKAIS